MPIDRVTLIVSDVGIPAPHAVTHQSGGTDVLALAFGQIASVPTARLLGRYTAGTGVAQTISLGSGLTFSSGVLTLGAEILAVSGVATTGYLKRTGAATYTSTATVPYSDLASIPAAIDALDGLTPAANRFPYFTSSSAAALGTVSAFGLTLVDDVDAIAARTTLGLGTLATQNGTFSGTFNGSFSGTFSGTSSGTNTGNQTIILTGDVTGSGTGSFAATIANDAVTYAKMQNVSATDTILGRSTAGAGNVEEIPCTAAGRALLDDANAAAQRVTLGFASAAPTAAGLALLDDVSASAQRTTLGLGTIAVLNAPVGPYSGDGDAASNGVPIGAIYYHSSGALHVRLT